MKTSGILLVALLILTSQVCAQQPTTLFDNHDSKSDKVETTKAMTPPNLLLNPGAEDGLMHWEIDQGVAQSLIAFDCNGISPYSGDYYFAVGGLCEFIDVPGILTQVIDISSYADSVSSGEFNVNFGGYLSNWTGEDLPEMRLFYLDDADNLIGFSGTIATMNDTWTMVTATEALPATTASIKVELEGTQLGGSFNDSYFDDMFVWLGAGELDPPTSMAEQTQSIRSFEVAPNPVQSVGVIELPNTSGGKIKFSLSDLTGSKVPCQVEYFSDRIIIKNNGELNGLCLFTVAENEVVIGKGKVLFNR